MYDVIISSTKRLMDWPTPIVGDMAIPLKSCWEDGLPEDTYMPKPGVTSLMKAAVQETPAEIAALLKAGADINAEDSSGWTTQVYSAQAAKLESLKFLLTAGAEARHRSEAGETVIFAAVSSWYDPCNESEFAQGGRN